MNTWLASYRLERGGPELQSAFVVGVMTLLSVAFWIGSAVYVVRAKRGHFDVREHAGADAHGAATEAAWRRAAESSWAVSEVRLEKTRRIQQGRAAEAFERTVACLRADLWFLSGIFAPFASGASGMLRAEDGWLGGFAAFFGAGGWLVSVGIAIALALDLARQCGRLDTLRSLSAPFERSDAARAADGVAAANGDA